MGFPLCRGNQVGIANAITANGRSYAMQPLRGLFDNDAGIANLHAAWLSVNRQRIHERPREAGDSAVLFDAPSGLLVLRRLGQVG